MANQASKSNPTIDRILPIDERITARGGLAWFARYLKSIELDKLVQRWLGSLRKSGKGAPIVDLVEQILCFFVEGTHLHVSHFDELAGQPGYAGLLEKTTGQLVSSHTVKRFFKSFSFVRIWWCRRLLQQLFIWRLRLEQPELIQLDIDVMGMDNDQAEAREGVAPTYKGYAGFAPLQMSWGPYYVDAVFRGGDKHSLHGQSVPEMVRHIVGRIRSGYRADVPIVITHDAGFFCEELMECYEQLQIGYLIGGRSYKQVKQAAAAMPDEALYEQAEGDGQWQWTQWGDRRASWSRFRRVIYARKTRESNGQGVLACDDFGQVIYTNLGMHTEISRQLTAVKGPEATNGEALLARYHRRGEAERNHRALKAFGTEQLPFQDFTANAAFYYHMLVAFTLCEAFKTDYAPEALPARCYAQRFRRQFMDIPVKVVDTSGERRLRVSRPAYERLHLKRLWQLITQAVPIPVP